MGGAGAAADGGFRVQASTSMHRMHRTATVGALGEEGGGVLEEEEEEEEGDEEDWPRRARLPSAIKG
jgi:hypothetical protein